jgi:predicted phage baseplate assembly protein
VQFGDGNTGARLPTGQANVRAKYRKGIGLQGLVGADKITLLLSRPLGLKGATNPLPSSDAADPEPREEARMNAPLTVLTLDRVVSLRDYEDFARGYTGVAKALATWMQGKERRGVFVTVAGANGRPIANTAAIERALLDFGNRFVPVRVHSFRQVFFRLSGSVKIAPDRLPEVVYAAIEAKLRDEYSFARRGFGQPVFRSEVIALMQNIPGVLSVTLTTLRTDTQTASPLLAAVPEGEIALSTDGAELLVLDPRPLDLAVAK